MNASRKRYSREFKLEAVRQLLEGDRGLAQTARDLDLNRTMLSGWRKQYLEDPEGAFQGSGRRKQQEGEMDRLRREIEELREEREILKKAMAYYGEKKPSSSTSSKTIKASSE
jgi:transposase